MTLHPCTQHKCSSPPKHVTGSPIRPPPKRAKSPPVHSSSAPTIVSKSVFDEVLAADGVLKRSAQSGASVASASSAGPGPAHIVPEDAIKTLLGLRKTPLKPWAELKTRSHAQERMFRVATVFRGMLNMQSPPQLAESASDTDTQFRAECVAGWLRTLTELIHELKLSGDIFVGSLASPSHEQPVSPISPREVFHMMYVLGLSWTSAKDLWAFAIRENHTKPGQTAESLERFREVSMKLVPRARAVDMVSDGVSRADADAIGSTFRFTPLGDVLTAIVSSANADAYLDFSTFGVHAIETVTSIDNAAVNKSRDRVVEVASAFCANFGQLEHAPHARTLVSLSESSETDNTLFVQTELLMRNSPDHIVVNCRAGFSESCDACWMCRGGHIPTWDTGQSCHVHDLTHIHFHVADYSALNKASGFKSQFCIYCGLYTAEQRDVSPVGTPYKHDITPDLLRVWNKRYDAAQTQLSVALNEYNVLPAQTRDKAPRPTLEGQPLFQGAVESFPFMSTPSAFAEFKSMMHVRFDWLHLTMNMTRDLITMTFFRQAAQLQLDGHPGILLLA